MRRALLVFVLAGCSAPVEAPPLPPLRGPGPAPLRRLSDTQYLNALADLFPDQHPTLPVLPRDATVAGFENDAASQAPSDVRIARYAEIARLYADGYDPGRFPGVAALGARLFRRPLTPDERERFGAAFGRWEKAVDRTAAIRLTVEAMLQTPQFLYRIHEAEPARLALLLWESVPDETATGAERMLDDPRSGRVRWSFHRQWLGLDRIVRDEWEPELQRSMLDDTRAYVEGVTTLDELLGVLVRPAWLAGNSHRGATSPPMRGSAIQSRLLCLPPVSPPADADLSPPMQSEGVTNRQRFEERTKAPACQGCHLSLNGIGFGFEHYDAVGVWQELDHGERIDARGELYGTDVDGPFDGAQALLDKLALSRDVRRCAAQRWLQYALGRAPLEAEAPLVEALAESKSLHALLLELARSR